MVDGVITRDNSESRLGRRLALYRESRPSRWALRHFADAFSPTLCYNSARFHQPAGLQPTRKAALQEKNVPVSQLLEAVGCRGSSIPSRTIEQDQTGPVWSYFGNLLLQRTSSDILRPLNVPTKKFFFLANVHDQRQLFEFCQTSGRNLARPAVVSRVHETGAMARRKMAG
jgi:hypothetical protein